MLNQQHIRCHQGDNVDQESRIQCIFARCNPVTSVRVCGRAHGIRSRTRRKEGVRTDATRARARVRHPPSTDGKSCVIAAVTEWMARVPHSVTGTISLALAKAEFKLDHLQPVAHNFFPAYPTFHSHSWEHISYYPRGIIMRRGYSPKFDPPYRVRLVVVDWVSLT